VARGDRHHGDQVLALQPATASALRLERVAKVFPGSEGGPPLEVLRDVSLDVPLGRKVAVRGRSGSGKSTVLHLAAGIDEPTSGRVLTLGRDVSALSEPARTIHRRDHVGLVFQFFHLVPYLSVRDNVLLPAWIAAEPHRAAEDRAQELLDRVGLRGREGDAVERLSGGEQQRVAICRALLRRPRLLLADEPTGNLDDDTSRRVMDLLLELADAEGSALVYVTHSAEVAALADEVHELRRGVLERS
jgi:putative ABC transport system ATP-binding protein